MNCILKKRIDLAQIVEPEDWIGMKIINLLELDHAHELIVERDLTPAQLYRVLESEARSTKAEVITTTINRWNGRREKLQTDEILDSTRKLGISLLSPEDPAWPHQLNQLEHLQPIVLWCRGDASRLSQSQIAIVGSRACSQYGQAITDDLATSLSKSGFHITSGGAYGIDAVAHRSVLNALDQDQPTKRTTIAVLAGGIDRLYPAGNKELLENIQRKGAIVSEVVLGRPPTRYRFLSRNRIIAALSELVIVTEAQFRSGALNTAHHALNMGIPVAAIPGSVYSATSAGCHRLVKETPTELVTGAADVLTMLNKTNTVEGPEPMLDMTSLLVLDSLPVASSVPIDRVIERTGLSAQRVQAILTRLAREGFVAENQQLWRSTGRTMKAGV